MFNKKCTICNENKDSSCFYKDKRTKSGLYSSCKKCHNLRNKNYQINYQISYHKTKKYKKYQKEYQNNWFKKSLKNPKNRVDNNIRSVICRSLRGEKAGRKWESLVGYTIKDLMNHLEKQFDDKMSWDNYGSYWWVDYIKAKSLFHYIKPEDSEFKQCWALNNLQPLEKIANIKKSNK